MYRLLFIAASSLVSSATSSEDISRTLQTFGKPFGRNGLCVIGCTPYVDFKRPDHGIAKYRALLSDMADQCDVIVHIGDTKPGNMPCNRTLLTETVDMMVDIAAEKGRLALFAPGDNEICDCHRHYGRAHSEIYRADEARQAILEDLGLLSDKRTTDLTGRFPVEEHAKDGNVPGTNRRYSCDFDKYVELNNYAVATIEVIGSHYYLDDERKTGYPKQNEADPLGGRLSLYLNANDCALEWIEQSAAKASASGKRAVFFLMHASFYTTHGESPIGTHSIGDFYNSDNLRNYTLALTGTAISKPFQPLFDKLTETALAYPDLAFYVVHSDAHRFSTLRMNPAVHNRGEGRIYSNHNLMLHQVEGASRALTMYSKFTVDDSFQPVTLKQEWSQAAFDEEPYGHSWVPYRYS